MSESLHAIDPEEEIRRAGEAERLLNHPLIVNALMAIEATWDVEWKQSTPTEPDKREEAYRMLRTAYTFRKLLTKYVTDGKLAAESMDRAAQQKAALEEPL